MSTVLVNIYVHLEVPDEIYILVVFVVAVARHVARVVHSDLSTMRKVIPNTQTFSCSIVVDVYDQ